MSVIFINDLVRHFGPQPTGGGMKLALFKGTRPGGKKAIVKLAEGQSIPIFEGVA